MILSQQQHMGALQRSASCRMLGQRLSTPARLAQHRQPLKQLRTSTCALPVSDLAQEIHTHAAAVYDLADAAAAAAGNGSSSSSGFLSPLTDTLETVLKTIQSQLNRLHVPYSYGWSIVFLTVIVKMVTLPLTKIQVGCVG